MKCQNCGNKEASFHYTQIINGVKKQLDLCEDCAKELGINKGLEFDIPMGFNSFLGDLFGDYASVGILPSFDKRPVACDKCQMTYTDFVNTGLFGCSNCYDIFEGPIDSLLKNLHGTATHIGRKPRRIEEYGKDNFGKVIKKEKEVQKNEKEKDKLSNLQKELENAIAEERYEDAAKIRDEIKKQSK